jgi:hypothetical protein
VYELKLKFLDLVMAKVRREEDRYQQYAIDPPEYPPSKTGLFGLPVAQRPGFFPGGGLLSPTQNALMVKPPLSRVVHDELVSQIKEDLVVIDHLAGMLEMRGSVERARLFGEALAFMPTYEVCHQEWRALRQHLDADLKERVVLYVGRLNNAHFGRMEHDWAPGPCPLSIGALRGGAKPKVLRLRTVHRMRVPHDASG